MTADYACKTIDPNNPAGPPIDAIFPGDLTLRYYKYSPVRYGNLVAAKYVLQHTRSEFSSACGSTTKAGGAIPAAPQSGI